MLLVALLFATLLAQAQPDTKELLRKVAEVYANMREGDVTATGTVTFPGSPEVTIRSRIAWRLPDKTRTESNEAGRHRIMVSNGKLEWLYESVPNEYIQTPVAPRQPSALTPPGLEPGSPPLSRFATSAKEAQSAKFLRQETVMIDGVRFECSVIEFKGPTWGLLRWWVDKRSLVVREEMFTKTEPTARFSLNDYVFAKFNQRVPDSVFVFMPPPGAKRVEHFKPR